MSKGAVPVRKVEEADRKKILDLCSDFVIKDCRPFTAINGLGFQQLLTGFLEITTTTISRHITQMASEKKLELRETVQGKLRLGEISITTDLWVDSFVRRSFLCATIHYIHNCSLESFVLGMKSMDYDKATAQNIRIKLLGLLQEFGISEIRKIKFVTDRGRNITKSLEGCNRINCSNHLFSNVLDESFNSIDIKNLTDSCKSLVRYFKKANIQHLLGTTLKNHCPTRWNSHFLMFKSIADNWLQILEILQDRNEIGRLSAINFSHVESLVELCNIFNVVSTQLQSSKVPSLCLVLPSRRLVKQVCEVKELDHELIKKFKTEVFKNVESIWVSNLNIWHKVDLFLLPPSNRMQEENLVEIKVFCIKEIETNFDRESSLADLPSCINNPTPTKTPSKNNVKLGFFSPDLVTIRDISNPETVKDEVDRYASEIVPMGEDFDVLNWWHSNRYNKIYPRLSK